MQVEVYGVVTASDDAESGVLLVPDGSEWDLPGAVIDLTESIEAAVMRIIKERTGIDVSVGALMGLYQRPENARLALVFRCEFLAGDLESGQWAPPRELPSGTRPTVRLRIADALRGTGRVGLRLQ